MPKPVGRYVYWSERLVREVIDDNGVQLESRVKASLKLGVAGGGLDLEGRDREKTTFEVAEKLKRKLRRSIVSDLDTSGPLQLVQGASWLEAAEFQRWGYHVIASGSGPPWFTPGQSPRKAGVWTSVCLVASKT